MDKHSSKIHCVCLRRKYPISEENASNTAICVNLSTKEKRSERCFSFRPVSLLPLFVDTRHSYSRRQFWWMTQDSRRDDSNLRSNSKANASRMDRPWFSSRTWRSWNDGACFDCPEPRHCDRRAPVGSNEGRVTSISITKYRRRFLTYRLRYCIFTPERIVRTGRTGDVRWTEDGMRGAWTRRTVRPERSLPDIRGDQFDHQWFGIFIRHAFDVSVRYFTYPCG